MSEIVGPIFQDRYRRYWFIDVNLEARKGEVNYGVFVREVDGVDSDCTTAIITRTRPSDYEGIKKQFVKFATRQGWVRVRYAYKQTIVNL